MEISSSRGEKVHKFAYLPAFIFIFSKDEFGVSQGEKSGRYYHIMSTRGRGTRGEYVPKATEVDWPCIPR